MSEAVSTTEDRPRTMPDVPNANLAVPLHRRSGISASRKLRIRRGCARESLLLDVAPMTVEGIRYVRRLPSVATRPDSCARCGGRMPMLPNGAVFIRSGPVRRAYSALHSTLKVTVPRGL